MKQKERVEKWKQNKTCKKGSIKYLDQSIEGH